MFALRLHFPLARCLILLFLQDISADEFDFRQTIPEAGEVCPGEKLQYMCTALIELHWEIDSSSPFSFTQSMQVNSTGTIDDFSLLLTSKLTTDTGTKVFSTATNDMITSSYDGQQVVCYSGPSSDDLTIEVADGPADCSIMSVSPECRATTSAVDETETELLITLKTTNSLMCVVGYQILFNGQSKTVFLTSPSASFTVTVKEGEAVSNEIVVYTLDYENRTGQMPCTFSIAQLDAVEGFLEPECVMRTFQNVDVTFRWEPAVVGGCLEDNVTVHYIIDFNDSLFNDSKTTSTRYTLTSIEQETVLEITISPCLPIVGLTGPPLSSTVDLAKISCSTSTSSVTSSVASSVAFFIPTSSPSTTPGGDNQTVDNAMGVPYTIVIFAVVMSLIIVIPIIVGIAICVFMCFKKYKGTTGKLDGNEFQIPLTADEASNPDIKPQEWISCLGLNCCKGGDNRVHDGIEPPVSYVHVPDQQQNPQEDAEHKPACNNHTPEMEERIQQVPTSEYQVHDSENQLQDTEEHKPLPWDQVQESEGQVQESECQVQESECQVHEECVGMKHKPEYKEQTPKLEESITIPVPENQVPTSGYQVHEPGNQEPDTDRRIFGPWDQAQQSEPQVHKERVLAPEDSLSSTMTSTEQKVEDNSDCDSGHGTDILNDLDIPNGQEAKSNLDTDRIDQTRAHCRLGVEHAHESPRVSTSSNVKQVANGVLAYSSCAHPDLDMPSGPEANKTPCTERTDLGGGHGRQNVGRIPPRVCTSPDHKQVSESILEYSSSGQGVEPLATVSKAEANTEPHDPEKQREVVGLRLFKQTTSENSEDELGKVDESDQLQSEYMHPPAPSETTDGSVSQNRVLMDDLPQLPKDDEGDPSRFVYW